MFNKVKIKDHTKEMNKQYLNSSGKLTNVYHEKHLWVGYEFQFGESSSIGAKNDHCQNGR